MMTDPIADMLTRIRNGSKAKLEKVDIPSSKLKLEIAKILKDEGYNQEPQDGQGPPAGCHPRLSEVYDDEAPVIQGIKRVSKPGCRVYAGTMRSQGPGRAGRCHLSTRGHPDGKAGEEGQCGRRSYLHVW